MSALREILAVFDIVVNDQALDMGNKKLDTFVERLKGIGQAIAAFGIVKSVASFGEHVAEAAREVEFHAGRMEMDVDEYQRLSQVAGNYGMTMENLQIANTLFVRSLSNVGGVLGDFHGNAKHAHDAMRNLGLDPAQFRGQRLIQILPTIADAFKKIEDPLQRVTIGLNLFGHRGRSIMPMMAQGGEELRRQFAAAVPVFEQATITSANEATIAGKQLARTWENLINNSFGKAILDVFTVVARKLTDIVLAVKELIKYSEIGKGMLVALGTALVTAAVMAIAAWWPVLAPILAVLAAMAALSLAVDDFIVFMKGGDSILGDFFDSILGPGGAETAKKAIEDLWNDLKSLLVRLKEYSLADIFAGWRDTVAATKREFEAIRSAIEWILSKASDFNLLMGGSVAAPLKAREYDRRFRPGSPTSAYAGVANIPAPAFIASDPDIVNDIDHRPTPADAAKGMTFNVVGTIDPVKLQQDLARVAEHHMNEAVGRVLRDTAAGVGGAQ